MDRARSNENMNAGTPRPLHRFISSLDILLRRPCQTTDDRPADFMRNRLHRFEIAGGGDRKTGLDDIDAEPLKLPRNFQFFPISSQLFMSFSLDNFAFVV